MARTLVRATEVVTCNGSNEVIQNGALILEGDSIAAAGPAEQLAAQGPFDREIGSADGHVAIPGLINAHHHVARPERAALPETSLETWLVQMRERMLPSLGEEEVYDHTLWDAIQHLKNGVTAVMDHHTGDGRKPDFGIPPALHAYVDSGMRAVVCPAARVQGRWAYVDDEAFVARLPEPLQSEVRARSQPFPVDRYFASWHELYKTYHGAKARLHLAFGPAGPQWVPDDVLLRMKQEAREHGVGIHIHVLETRYQALYAQRTFGKTLIERMHEMGLLGPDLACAHCVWLTEQDQRIMADTGTVAIHNPASNLALLSGVSPVAAGLERGVTIGLGTDATPLNDDSDILSDLRLGWYLQRPPGIGRLPIAPERMLGLATRGGAAALWQQSSIGSLEPGKKADIVLLDRARLYGWAYASPTRPVIDTILRRGTGRQVDTVLVGGQVVVQGGRYLLADEEAVNRRVTDSMARYFSLIAEADHFFERVRPHIVAFYQRWEEESAQLLASRHQYNVR